VTVALRACVAERPHLRCRTFWLPQPAGSRFVATQCAGAPLRSRRDACHFSPVCLVAVLRPPDLAGGPGIGAAALGLGAAAGCAMGDVAVLHYQRGTRRTCCGQAHRCRARPCAPSAGVAQPRSRAECHRVAVGPACSAHRDGGARCAYGAARLTRARSTPRCLAAATPATTTRAAAGLLIRSNRSRCVQRGAAPCPHPRAM